MNIVTSALTLSCFINAPSGFSGAFASNRTVGAKRVFAGPNRGWGILTRRKGASVNSAASGLVVTTSGIVVPLGSTNIDDGTWKHIALVYDGTDVRLYVAGVLEPTTATHPKALTGTILATLSDIFMFGNTPGSIGTNPWPEKIDEFSIFDVAKTPAEIATLAAGPVGGGATSAVYVSKAHTSVVGSPATALVIVDASAGVTLEVSRDDGVNFEAVTNGIEHTFGAVPAGTAMRVRATLPTASDELDNVWLSWKA